MIWFGKSFIKFCRSFVKVKKALSIQTFSLARVRFCLRECVVSSSNPRSEPEKCSRLRNTLCLCSPVRPAQAVQEPGVLPQELGHWFCSPNFLFSSGAAFRSNCQMTGRGSTNLGSYLNSAACQWPMCMKKSHPKRWLFDTLNRQTSWCKLIILVVPGILSWVDAQAELTLGCFQVALVPSRWWVVALALTLYV